MAGVEDKAWCKTAIINCQVTFSRYTSHGKLHIAVHDIFQIGLCYSIMHLCLALFLLSLNFSYSLGNATAPVMLTEFNSCWWCTFRTYTVKNKRWYLWKGSEGHYKLKWTSLEGVVMFTSIFQCNINVSLALFMVICTISRMGFYYLWADLKKGATLP